MNKAKISNLENNLDLIEINDKQIYLVGTAHISEESAELAEKTIREIKPDAVAVELCQPRYDSLQNPDRWKNTDIITVIKEGKSYVLLAQLILAGFQKKLGENLKVKPGEDMMRSIRVAKEVGSEIVLADRKIRTTLKRTWSNLSIFSMIKVLFSMIASLFTTEQLDKEEIERLKSSDALDELMKDFSKALPEVKESLITERDKYLAEKMRSASGKSIVAVVGAGHVPGIKEWISKDIDMKALDEIPKPKLTRKIIGWGIPILVIGLIIAGFVRSGGQTSSEMLKMWFIANFFLAGIGAILALAHPITILAAALASPFTSLNPMIAAGWVGGIVEATIRKPRVSDLENISDDATSIRGFYKNRVTKVLLVICLVNLFGTIGTFWGIERIVSLWK